MLSPLVDRAHHYCEAVEWHEVCTGEIGKGHGHLEHGFNLFGALLLHLLNQSWHGHYSLPAGLLVFTETWA